jgi:hypothetical protein
VVAVTNHTVTGASLVSGNASYRPLTNPLTATDAGATATVSIAAFTMRVAGTDLSINSGSITTLTFSTLYYIYYVDSTFSGGAVTYYASTTKEDAHAGANRFFVGSIRTPASGGFDKTGNNDGGSGSQFGIREVVYPSQNAVVGAAGFTDPTYAHDKNNATYAYGTDSNVLNQAKQHKWYGWTNSHFDPAATSVTLRATGFRSSTGSAGGTLRFRYSTDGGTGWTTVWSTSSDSPPVFFNNSVSIGASVDLTQLVAEFYSDWASGTGTLNISLYELWVEVLV